MADGVVYTGFDPVFGDKLNQLIALAKARGYSPQLISGRRDAYGWPGMKGQSQADLYSQLGKPGGPKAAAPPGYSPHQYGVAGDVAGLPQSVLEQLASEVGLRAIHSDPNHLELPDWQKTVATQPPMTAWDQSNPADVPSRMAMNVDAGAGPQQDQRQQQILSSSQPSRPATTTPGVTLNSSPMDLVANLESGNRNIPQAIHDINTDRGTPAGGYFQIIDPTWRRYAPAAGVDLNQYPTAMSTNDRSIQAKVASAIPVNQWGPSTVAALKAKYPGIDTSLTLGAFQSQALGGSGAVAGGPTPPAGGPAAPAAPGQPAYAPGSPAAKLQALGKAGQALEKAAGADSGGDQPPDFKLAPIQPAQPVGGAMMMGAGGQNTFAQRAAQQGLAQQGFMLQPSLAAFGAYNPPSPIGAPSPGGATPGSAQGMPAMPGTTLNSPSQLQMAMATGQMDPNQAYSDLYNQLFGGQRGGYGMGSA